MIRTFFYSLSSGPCGESCRWRYCPHRFLSQLASSSSLLDIYPLWGELRSFSLSWGTVPKSDDVVIIYAADETQLSDAVAKKELFEGLRTILVVADTTGMKGDQYHLLAPRYITQADRNIQEIGEVITKMHGVNY